MHKLPLRPERALLALLLFLIVVAATGQEPSPSLEIRRSQVGNISLLWPSVLSNYVVESAASLRPPVPWNPVNAPFSLQGSQRVLSFPTINGSSFYRLRASDATGLQIEAETTATKLIEAARGGTIELGGGDLTLTVPPNALLADTQITITNRTYVMLSDAPLLGQVQMLPHGATFQTPASLSIRLPEGVAPEDVLTYSISGMNEREAAGAEINLFEPLTNRTFEASSRRLTIPVSHFSSINFAIDRFNRLYLAFDIPGKFLKKGDLLICLNTKPKLLWKGWYPGHAGLYLGTRDALSRENDDTTTIESTTEGMGYVDGVQFAELNKFKELSGQHIYLGARRPPGGVTDEQRNKIASWAIEQLGKPYGLVGGSFLFDDDKLSCVGLNERAYESAGINIVPGVMECPLLPQLQYAYTKPVTEVTVKAGEAYQMFVMGVVSPSRIPWPPVWSFSSSSEFYTVGMQTEAGSPAEKAVAEGRAKVSEVAGLTLFAFRPAAADGGKDHRFNFTVNADKVGAGEVSQSFTVHVEPAYVRQDPPRINVTLTAGTLPKAQMAVTETSATIPGQNGGTFQVSWPLPPQYLMKDEIFDWQLSSSAPGSFPAQIQESVASSFPSILVAAPGLGESPAFPEVQAHAGFQFIGNCVPNRRSIRCFNFTQQSKRMVGQMSVSGGKAVVQLTSQWYNFGLGTVVATIEWDYKPVE